MSITTAEIQARLNTLLDNDLRTALNKKLTTSRLTLDGVYALIVGTANPEKPNEDKYRQWMIQNPQQTKQFLAGILGLT
jgi:hypothetical protein